MIRIDQVSQHFGSLVALDQVSLEIAAGECFGLLGPNGAGKSTLMSLIAGLRPPSQGRLQIGTTEVSVGSAEARRHLGFAPQHLALYPQLSARENLEIFGRLHGLHGARLRTRVSTLLDAVQLADRADDRASTFSGGMQRRLNLAAALLHEPRVLLCDEPTVGVDPQSRNAIFEFLEARRAEGLTILYSTHYMEEATRLCSRIGIIDHGKVLALGTLDELLTRLPFTGEISFPAAAVPPPFLHALQDLQPLLREGPVVRFRPPAQFPFSRFYQLAEAHGVAPVTFTHQRPSLEAVFLHLTGRHLRD